MKSIKCDKCGKTVSYDTADREGKHVFFLLDDQLVAENTFDHQDIPFGICCETCVEKYGTADDTKYQELY